MYEVLEIEPFLKQKGLLYDVRSPGEFIQGSIPGACNLPLFTDEERKRVGTTYKQVSAEKAFLEGLELVGPKLKGFAEIALQGDKNPRLFCFRGGMRSQSMAWLFRSCGLHPVTLKGGYKAFRRFVLETLKKPYSFQVIGGFTGSGKTAILSDLRTKGVQTIDLEALAHHRGSSFGMLGMEKQPSNEAFENSLAMALYGLDLNQTIFIEDESRLIGSCKIPDTIFNRMKNSPLLFIDRPKSERVEILLNEYGGFAVDALKHALEKLHKRLGSERKLQIQRLMEEGNFRMAASELLDYYDKAYAHSTMKRQQVPFQIKREGLTTEQWSSLLRLSL